MGISREGGLIDLGVEQGVVRKSGAWYTYDGTQLGQGKENSRNFLRDNADMANEIEKKIKEKLGVPTAGDDSSESGATSAGDTTAAEAGSAGTTSGASSASTGTTSTSAAGSTKRSTKSKAAPPPAES